MKSRLYLIAVYCLLPLLPGCTFQLPRVRPPKIDAAAAAAGALKAFDVNQDGQLSRDEAQACLGIESHWNRYDRDGDDAVSGDELQARFGDWSAGDTGLMNVRAEIKYRGQHLTDATVEMTPYDFLGPHFLSARGTTDQYGFAFLAIPKEQLPKSQQGTFGMQVGLYRVSITHPEIDLPAKYNSETELSVDLDPADSNAGVRFDLK